MKQKTVIIDDEKYARQNLVYELEKYSNSIEIIGEANSVKTAIELIEKLKPDLIFLDINLGDGTGFDVLDKLKYKNFKTVFLTAYDNYAIKALKLNALDYMLKPLNKNELQEVVLKINEFEKEKKALIQSFLQDNKQVNKQQKIAIPSNEGLILFEVDEILRCQSDGNYTIIFLRNKNKMISSKTLKHFDELLEQFQFSRVHNSHLINLKYVSKYLNKLGGVIVMSDGCEIPISQRKKSYVLNVLGQRLG